MVSAREEELPNSDTFTQALGFGSILGSDRASAEVTGAENKHLLGQTPAAATSATLSGNAANYGALNTSRLNGDGDCEKGDASCSDMDSSMFETQSQMGESVRYREHVSQYTRERTGELLLKIRDRVTFFGMSVLVLVPATLLANGMGSILMAGQEEPLVVQTGCDIGLDKWYIFLTGLACFKLLIEVWRYMYVKVNYQESILLHAAANYVLMPIAFGVFFVTTQLKFEHANPDPDHLISYREAQHTELAKNACATADLLSQSLYSTFQIVSVLSYVVVFYYIVALVVVAQSICLIKAIVQRRIHLMRRRDLEQEQSAAQGNGEQEPLTLAEFQEEMAAMEEQEGGNLFIEGMFGGLLTVPLPVPEIISSLDKSKFKHKQAAQKKKAGPGAAADSGLWRQCPICWSDFLRNDFVTTLHCDEKHIFHTECIEQWIRKGQNSCPLCRQTIANL